MFGIGGSELILILLVALLVFGPGKLPELARGLGKAMGEFNRAKMDLQREINLAGQAKAPAEAPAPTPAAPAEAPAPAEAAAHAPAAEAAEASKPTEPEA